MSARPKPCGWYREGGRGYQRGGLYLLPLVPLFRFAVRLLMLAWCPVAHPREIAGLACPLTGMRG